MSKVAFVDFADNFYDRHAVYSLISLLEKRNHQVNYVSARSMEKAVHDTKKLNPDLLLYSSFTSDIPVYANFDKRIKEEINTKSLIGGHGPTYDPELVLETTIDSLCVGEGETALADFVDNGFVGQKNIINRLDYEKTGTCTSDYNAFSEMDDLPIPLRHSVYEHDAILRNQPAKQFMAGRGCPYLCTYCHNHAYNEKFKESGPIIRFKSVDYLIEEILEVKRRYPLKTVVFQDDVFILKRPWLFEFCEKFPRKVGLPFTCNVKAEIVARDDVVEALKNGGCSHAAWSIESGNDYIRNKVLKRNMSKKTIIRCADNLNKHKIPHRVGNIIGVPGENFENLLETIEINIEAKPNLAIGSVFVPYPGLELTDYALQKNFLDPKDANYLPQSLYEGSIIKFSPDYKVMLQRIAYMFPWLVQFPILYRKKFIFEKILCKLPPAILRYFYDAFFVAKMASFFKVQSSLRTNWAMLKRYFGQFKSKETFNSKIEPKRILNAQEQVDVETAQC